MPGRRRSPSISSVVRPAAAALRASAKAKNVLPSRGMAEVTRITCGVLAAPRCCSMLRVSVTASSKRRTVLPPPGRPNRRAFRSGTMPIAGSPVSISSWPGVWKPLTARARSSASAMAMASDTITLSTISCRLDGADGADRRVAGRHQLRVRRLQADLVGRPLEPVQVAGVDGARGVRLALQLRELDLGDALARHLGLQARELPLQRVLPRLGGVRLVGHAGGDVAHLRRDAGADVALAPRGASACRGRCPSG